MTEATIERLRLFLADPQALLRHDAQACLLNHRIDGARQIACGCIGLDDGKCALDGHTWMLLSRDSLGSGASATLSSPWMQSSRSRFTPEP